MLAHYPPQQLPLFAVYANDPALMPEEFQRPHQAQRGVADYIAGMTDRFAIREHRRLTGRDLLPGA